MRHDFFPDDQFYCCCNGCCSIALISLALLLLGMLLAVGQ